jgi:hypothetical protein
MPQLRVFVLPGGEIQIFGDTGPFAQASAATQQIIDALQAQGLPVKLIGAIEQHRPDGPAHVHVVQTQQQEASHER